MNYKTLDDVKRVISLGKSQSVIDKFWQSYQEGLQYETWFEQMQADYDLLFPETEEVTKLDADGNTVTETVDIDYSNNPDYLPFDEWMQVREELTGTRDIILDDGTPSTETYTYEGNLLREFIPQPVAASVSDLSEYQAMRKKQKYDAIANLTVTTTVGNIFDADELSRQRMADAILASQTTGLLGTQWKLTDNSIATVTYDELREAHALALQAFGEVILGV